MSIGFQSTYHNFQVLFTKPNSPYRERILNENEALLRVSLIRNFEANSTSHFECLNPKLFINKNNSILYVYGLDKTCRFDLESLHMNEVSSDIFSMDNPIATNLKTIEEERFRGWGNCCFNELIICYEKAIQFPNLSESIGLKSFDFSNFCGKGFVVEEGVFKTRIRTGRFVNSKLEGKVKTLIGNFVITQNFSDGFAFNESIKVENFKEKTTLLGKGDIERDGRINIKELYVFMKGSTLIEVEFQRNLTGGNFEGYGRIIFQDGSWVSGYIVDNRLAVSSKNRFKCLFYDDQAFVIKEVFENEIVTEKGSFFLDYQKNLIIPIYIR